MFLLVSSATGAIVRERDQLPFRTAMRAYETVKLVPSLDSGLSVVPLISYATKV
jgi:hypothetical protein